MKGAAILNDYFERCGFKFQFDEKHISWITQVRRPKTVKFSLFDAEVDI